MVQGKFFRLLNDFLVHIYIVQEALQFHADDDVALCALARLYLMTDDLDQCQYSCMTLLRWAHEAYKMNVE